MARQHEVLWCLLVNCVELFFCVCVASRFIAMPHCRCCVLHSLQFEIMCGALIRFWLKLLTTASSAICSYFSSVMLQFGEWNIIFHVWKREKERSIFPMAKVWMEAMSAVEFFFREEKKAKSSLIFSQFTIFHERGKFIAFFGSLYGAWNTLLSFFEWIFWPENDGWSLEWWKNVYGERKKKRWKTLKFLCDWKQRKQGLFTI